MRTHNLPKTTPDAIADDRAAESLRSDEPRAERLGCPRFEDAKGQERTALAFSFRAHAREFSRTRQAALASEAEALDGIHRIEGLGS